MTHRRRPGVSLLETIVALAVSGIVLLGAHTMVEGLGDNTRHLHASAERWDDEANRELALRLLADRVEVATDSTARFVGNEREVRFSSWCEAGGGWLERCAITISFVRHDTGYGLVVNSSLQGAITLRTGVRAGRLLYLSSAADGGAWQQHWTVGVTAPLAIGVVADGDTLIVRLGGRG